MSLPYLGGKLPKKTKFNHFFDSDTDSSLRDKFHGLCLLYPWLLEDKFGFTQNPQRFMTQSCGDDPWRILFFGPLFLGAFGSLLIVISIFSQLLPSDIEGETFPWWIWYTTIIWNISVLNLLPIFKRIAPPNLAYFDRKTRKVGYTFDIPGCTERDEFGNCCFPWREIECNVAKITTSQHGAQAYAPFISHEHSFFQYKNTEMTIVVTENAQDPIYCLLFWEELVRFMDNKKPLPDVPRYEAVRHLDPVTAEYDVAQAKAGNPRPEVYWRDMSFEQQEEIYKELLEECFELDWFNLEPRDEITAPWQRWTPKPELKDTLNWKYKAKRLAWQLGCGFP
ncbi:hypothetical protein PCIT_a4531 [Pseudoalteromonas citrea]|uniref:Uncharacterized protein n=2 Tax=Pseudoalteromonas citrea TaxID=43655 RepID=A0AAD4AIH5_9GAMM|nr:hypothetical protein [Pseudoalteromonas citrea]KAF7770204.1 hypothetical protein PCIT_a4531 [Pseudoalteromonas citrea]